MSLINPPKRRYLGKPGVRILGSYLAATGLLLIVALACVWGLETVPTPALGGTAESQDLATAAAETDTPIPDVVEPPADTTAATQSPGPVVPPPVKTTASANTSVRNPAEKPSLSRRVVSWTKNYKPTKSAWLFLVVMLAGALGSWLHGMSSFLAFVGNRVFVTSWVAWYVARPLVGAGLALIVYFLLRGGLLASQQPEALNEYGFAAFAALVGLFTDRATRKLRDVFDVIFGTAVLEDPLVKAANPKPVISGVEPESISAGSPATTVTISGEGFVSDSKVTLDGKEVEGVKFRNEQLVLTVPKAKLASAADIVVAVVNAKPGGGAAEETWKVT